MSRFDGKAFGEEIVAAVKSHVAIVTKPLIERITALEKALGEIPEPKEIDANVIHLAVAAEVAKIPAPEKGKDAEPELIVQMIEEAIAKLPRVDVDVEIFRNMIAEEVGKLPLAELGKNVDVEVVRSMVAEEMSKLPPAEPGKDAPEITREQILEALVPSDPGALSVLKEVILDYFKMFPIKDGAPGKDGLGLAGAFIDLAGNLVVTRTDGTPTQLGRVVGQDADPKVMFAAIKEEVDKIPRPKDGADGVGFDDLEMALEDDRLLCFRFIKGDIVKEFSLPLATPIYRGVWREGNYQRGDCVTWGGSSFIAQRSTAAQPETPEAKDDWQLSVKRGRNGKDIDRKEFMEALERAVALAVKGLKLEKTS